LKLAAIDIGSNAVRLLFIHVYETEDGYKYVKDALYRVPLRLGEDVFSKGKLSKSKTKDFINTMVAFKKLIKVFEPIEYMACATSAMRDASNGKEVLSKIYKKTGLKVKIISGQEEADILFSNHIEKLQPDPKQNYLFIDIGGGSTELILISKGEMIDRKSFNIGTLRLRDNQVESKIWIELDN
jgi:exopolyphosphatase/guanosine-5'-triphosphate,3'-diphosphate pyrophosphatase